MPIINGKKRYIPDDGSVNKNNKDGTKRAPWIQEEAPSVIQPAASKKRYHRVHVEEEKTPRVIKRYQDGGGPAVTAAVTQDIGNFVGSYEFAVQFSIGRVSFSKISNLGGSIEVGTFVEGGNNDYPMIYKTSRRRPDVLILQKGVADSTIGNLLLSQLKEGTKVYGLLIFVKKNGSTVKTFSITEGIILSRKYSNLDAGSSNLFIQQLEIAHTGMTEV